MRPWEAEGLDWATERVIQKLLDRGIFQYQVEQVFLNAPAYKRNLEGNTGDWKMIGWTNGSRELTIIVLTIEETRLLRPITGWPATELESKYFHAKRRRLRR